jgi:hypothetical protein
MRELAALRPVNVITLVDSCNGGIAVGYVRCESRPSLCDAAGNETGSLRQQVRRQIIEVIVEQSWPGR